MAESPLLALPKELRLTIYESVYSSNFRTSAQALDNIQQPSKALLLTCRITYDEAKVLYRQHFRAFWASSKFELALDDDGSPNKQVEKSSRSIPSTDFAHINHLTIFFNCCDREYNEMIISLVHNHGGWHTLWRDTNNDGELNTWHRYRVWTRRASPDQQPVVVKTKAAWDPHASEKELWEACENFRRRGGHRVPLRNQVFEMLNIELVDE